MTESATPTRRWVRGIIFDVDGTLADTLPLSFEAFRYAFGKYTSRIYTDDEIAAHFGPTEEGVIRTLLPNHWEECVEIFQSCYRDWHQEKVRPVPGIVELLAWLRERGFLTGIVTGKGARSGAVTLEGLGLHEYISAVRYGSIDGEIKSAMIREILAEWQISADQAAYIGDMASDIRIARAAGVVPLGAAWLNGAQADILCSAGAEAVFTEPTAIAAWLINEEYEKRSYCSQSS